MAQSGDDPRDVIFLEEPDGSDAGGPGLETFAGIFQSDSTESQNRDLIAAGFAELVQACGVCVGRVFLFEDRGEDCEGCLVGGGLGYVRWRVTGNSYERTSW